MHNNSSINNIITPQTNFVYSWLSSTIVFLFYSIVLLRLTSSSLISRSDYVKHTGLLCISLCAWFLLQKLLLLFTLMKVVTYKHGCKSLRVVTVIFFYCSFCYEYHFVLSCIQFMYWDLATSPPAVLSSSLNIVYYCSV